MLDIMKELLVPDITRMLTALLIAGLIGLAFTAASKTLSSSQPPFQRVGRPWLFSLLSGSGPWGMKKFTMEKYVQYGYEQVIKKTSKPFIMNWCGLDHIFLPPKYLPDLKRAAAQHRLSFSNHWQLNEAFDLEFTVATNLSSSDLMANVIRRMVDQRLPQIIPVLQSEATYAMAQEIGSPREWTPFPAAQLFTKILHRITSRILMGPELSRDESFLRTSHALADSSIFKNSLSCSIPFQLFFGRFDRPLRRFISRIFQQPPLQRAMDLVLPIIQARVDEFKTATSVSDNEDSINEEKNRTARSDKNLDAIQWALSLTETHYPNKHDPEPERIALSLLHSVWATNLDTAGTLTQMIFQVLVDPVYLPALRSEIETALKVHDGVYYTKETLLSPTSMPLLDSFLWEINRLYPTHPVLTCVAQTVTTAATTASSSSSTEGAGFGFEFHDGLRLPPGSRIAVPTLAIHTDVANYHDPLRFDGWRFARLRNTDTKSVSREKEEEEVGEVAEESNCGAATCLPFAIGSHSCAGGRYAVLLIKLVFAKLIMEYDLKWDLNEGVIQKVRPANLSMNGMVLPNQTQKVWFRRRRGSVCG